MSAEEPLSQFSAVAAASFFDQDRRWLIWLERDVKLKHARTGEPLAPKRGRKGFAGARRYEPQDILDIADALLVENLISRLEHEAIDHRVRKRWYGFRDIEPEN